MTNFIIFLKESFIYFIQSRAFLSVAYLTVANLARLGISVHCQASVRSQYLVRLLSQCWIIGGHTIHPPVKGLLSPIGTEPTAFGNSSSKVAGLQVHATIYFHGIYLGLIMGIMRAQFIIKKKLEIKILCQRKNKQLSQKIALQLHFWHPSNHAVKKVSITKVPCLKKYVALSSNITFQAP